MAMKSERVGSHVPASAAGHGAVRQVMAWQVLSALLLLTMGAIHLYLTFNGVGGTLGKLFVLNAIGGLVLAIAMVVLRRQLLLLASVLSTLFMAGTLLALILALTVGLFGIHEVLSYQLVPTTLVVESIGTVVLAVTTALLYRPLRGSLTAARAGSPRSAGTRHR
jgi:hypothetical protein